MKIFRFNYEDGPCAYNCHDIEIEAETYQQARKILVSQLKESKIWDYVGDSNIHYIGTKANLTLQLITKIGLWLDDRDSSLESVRNPTYARLVALGYDRTQMITTAGSIAIREEYETKVREQLKTQARCNNLVREGVITHKQLEKILGKKLKELK